MTENQLIAALDPNGFRPLSIGRMKNGAWVVSSETCAFEVVGAEWVRDVMPGEVIIIDDQGITYDCYTTTTQLAICSMEYIYFARPDSTIAGVNVHTARKRMERDWLRNFSMRLILWLVCQIPHYQQRWALQKHQACQMKWDWSRINIPNEPLSNQLRSFVSREFE